MDSNTTRRWRPYCTDYVCKESEDNKRKDECSSEFILFRPLSLTEVEMAALMRNVGYRLLYTVSARADADGEKLFCRSEGYREEGGLL